jgi:hypothetical protein
LQDQQATHVVQKALLSFGPENKEFIIEEGLAKFVDLCTHANGLCLMKKLIPACSKDPTKVQRIITLMTKHAMELVQSPYGNYAVQS